MFTIMPTMRPAKTAVLAVDMCLEEVFPAPRLRDQKLQIGISGPLSAGPDGLRRQKRARQRRSSGERLGICERCPCGVGPWLSLLSHVFDV
jgi:hypothetical protein